MSANLGMVPTACRIKQDYTVRFVTPAFLGDAEQNGAWRTPPFKSLLRQWWRVASAKSYNYNYHQLRQAEGRLFGNAWLEPVNGQSSFCSSRVWLRLASWKPGNLSSEAWPGGPMENVITTRDGKGRVRADVYMGYGPVLPPSKKENRLRITIKKAISPADVNGLSLIFEHDSQQAILATLQLIQWFGTLGSRSHNGWGSLLLQAAQDQPAFPPLPNPDDAVLQQISRPWQECLNQQWPHALGTEAGKPLLWITEKKPDWRGVLGCLANIKIQTRWTAKTIQGPAGIAGIHLLGYPAGGQWELKKLGKEARLASQLRFKVIPVDNGFVGLIAHLPCQFPDILKDRLDDQQQTWLDQNERQVWQAIHHSLNNYQRLQRLFGE